MVKKAVELFCACTAAAILWLWLLPAIGITSYLVHGGIIVVVAWYTLRLVGVTDRLLDKVLPPRTKVVEITADGVIIFDARESWRSKELTLWKSNARAVLVEPGRLDSAVVDYQLAVDEARHGNVEACEKLIDLAIPELRWVPTQAKLLAAPIVMMQSFEASGDRARAAEFKAQVNRLAEVFDVPSF